MGSGTNIGKVRTRRELSSRVVTLRARLGFFSIAVLKAIRRRHFCGCTGGFVLSGCVFSFFIVATVGQVACWKRSPSQWIRAVILFCLGQTFSKGISEPRGFKLFAHPQQEHKTVLLNKSLSLRWRDTWGSLKREVPARGKVQRQELSALVLG